MSKSATRYRDFAIEENVYGFWEWCHVEYDGPEDSRCGFEKTEQAARDAVDEWYEENE